MCHPEKVCSAAGLLLLAHVQEEREREREDEEPEVSDISVSTFHISVFLSRRAEDHILVRVMACTRLPPPALWAQTFSEYSTCSFL